jgi:hypothetical protein
MRPGFLILRVSTDQVNYQLRHTTALNAAGCGNPIRALFNKCTPAGACLFFPLESSLIFAICNGGINPVNNFLRAI